jgi:hypothetical protein
MALNFSAPENRHLHLGLVAGIVLLVLTCLIWIPDTPGYERYNETQGGCSNSTCHGAFTDATTTKGSTFPSNNKHVMHRDSAAMGTDCNMCHTNGDGRNPYIGSSQDDGNGDSPGPGCSGCHNGNGLRKHHAANSVTFCSSCHTLVDPPLENVNPEYYGTAGTLANDACNTAMAGNTGENWTTNDFIGLDNDGDNFYDTADPDCSVAASGAGESGQLLVTMEANGDLSFTWSDSCLTSDNDFGLYEGVLQPIPALGGAARVFNSHQFVQCTTTGAKAATITPTGDMQYYMVVPSNGAEEGSYGADSLGAERGQGVNSCATQIVAAC